MDIEILISCMVGFPRDSRYKSYIPWFVQIWKLTIFPQNGRKLESAENKIRDTLIQCLIFNKTIIPLTFVGY